MLKKILLGVGLLLLVAQFFRAPVNEVDNPEVYLSDLGVQYQMSDEVQAIHIKACYDCHSNHTNYPWYNAITPVNHWMYSHVRVGKKQLNYSDIATMDTETLNHKMDELIEEVEKGATERFLGMPLYSYKWTHSEARLSEKEIELLVEWAESMKR